MMLPLLLMLLLRLMLFLLVLVVVGTMLVLLWPRLPLLLEVSLRRRRQRSGGERRSASPSRPSTALNKLAGEMLGGGALRACRWALLVAGSSSLLISVGLAAVASHAWRLLVVCYALAAVAR